MKSLSFVSGPQNIKAAVRVLGPKVIRERRLGREGGRLSNGVKG